MGVHLPCTHASNVCVVLLYATAPANIFAHGIWVHISALHCHRLAGSRTNAVVPPIPFLQTGSSFGVDTVRSNMNTAGSSVDVTGVPASFAHPPDAAAIASNASPATPHTPRTFIGSPSSS
jgi:hypothetical protein